MITVFRKQFVYKYDGKLATIEDMDNKVMAFLDDDDAKFCNISNANLDLIINREFDTKLGE